MPHCIIEYSSDLEMGAQQLIDAVMQGALDSALFNVDDIKLRTISYENYQIATGKKKFIHVAMKILSGRSDEQKRNLSQAVLARLDKLDLTCLSLTVEVLDIDREVYAKKIK